MTGARERPSRDPDTPTGRACLLAPRRKSPGKERRRIGAFQASGANWPATPLLSRAIEELLRYEPPTQHMAWYVARDVAVHG
jgi:cytochrome P450